MAYRRQFNSNRREEIRLENYKGKNPMSRSQWRRHQRNKKAAKESKPMEIGESSTNNPKSVTQPGGKPPVSRKLFSPKKEVEVQKEAVNEEDLMTDDFESEGESFFNANCNVVSVLPCEFEHNTEVWVGEETDEEEMAKHRPVCYYIMNNGAVEEQNAFFERPDEGMKNHLKPLFIRAKVEQHGVNKVLVDGGAAVNLMPRFMLKRIGMQDSDVRPHNMVLSNYEGKVGKTLGVIQVNLTVGSLTRPTMFMVIAAKANYNMLLGREWIHGIGAVPSSMHQRLVLWRDDGIVENIEADQSYYMTDINHVDKRNFDRNMANIGPCNPPEEYFEPNENAYYSLTLRPNGFQWDRELMWDGQEVEEEGETSTMRPTGWGSEGYYD